jgi:hypothetical protein
MSADDSAFKNKVVQLILARELDQALKALSEHFEVDVPRVKVGLPKKYRNKAGCYSSKDKTIYVMNREALENPIVVLHEFYHHVRTHAGKHMGTEKYADKFAREFIEAFQMFHKYSFRVSYDRPNER